MKKTKTDRTILILTIVAMVIAIAATLALGIYAKELFDQLNQMQNAVNELEGASTTIETSSGLSYPDSFVCGGKLFLEREEIRNDPEIPYEVFLEFNNLYLDFLKKGIYGKEIPKDEKQKIDGILNDLGKEVIFADRKLDTEAFYDGWNFFIMDAAIQELYLGGYISQEVFGEYGAKSDKVLAEPSPEGVHNMLKEMEEIINNVQLNIGVGLAAYGGGDNPSLN